MRDVDAVFLALADRKRRFALYCLQEHHAVALADLAEFVAERESETEVADLSPEHVRDVYLSLYHYHVPELEAADLARYDQGEDLVAKTEHTDAALETARERVALLLADG